VKLEHHYLKLREGYPLAGEDEAQYVTLDELAAVLQCTHRNAALLLKKMAARGWLQWSPQRGRGRRSALCFRVPAEDLLLGLMQSLVNRHDLRGAMEQLHVARSEPLKERFRHWLDGYFGYSSELRGDRRFDTLRFPLAQPPDSLDPLTIQFAAEAHLVQQLFDPLVRYNRLTQSVIPHIAHAWETDASRTVWTFHLRKGILFHHGRELHADDVKYTFERLKQYGGGALYSWAHQRIEAVETLDPVTVRFRLAAPNELFLAYAATNRASIVPADVCAELGEQFARAPVGTGPFKLSLNDGAICILEAFPAYFQGRAHLDRVELWHMGEASGKEAYRPLDSFQILHNYTLPEDRQPEEWEQVQQQGATCRFLTFNLLKHGPLADPDLRGAVCAALDRTRLFERLGGDVLYAADSFVRGDAGVLGQTPCPQALPVAHDPAAVRALLKRLGYARERLVICTIPQYERDARLVQSMLQESGFAAEVRLLAIEDFRSEQRLQADLLLFSIMLDNDAEVRLIDLFTTMQRHLEPAAKAAVGRGLEEVLAERCPERRLERLERIEGYLAARRLLHFLYFKRLKTVFRTSVKGIALDSLDWVHFKDIWFENGAP